MSWTVLGEVATIALLGWLAARSEWGRYFVLTAAACIVIAVVLALVMAVLTV